MPPDEPVRMCVGCRLHGPKSDLLRVVRSSEGPLEVDASGRRPGRGAYLHPNRDCIDIATKRGALARALRVGLPPDELGRLREQLEGAVEK